VEKNHSGIKIEDEPTVWAAFGFTECCSFFNKRAARQMLLFESEGVIYERMEKF
jgi:hypothetical protein